MRKCFYGSLAKKFTPSFCPPDFWNVQAQVETQVIQGLRTTKAKLRSSKVACTFFCYCCGPSLNSRGGTVPHLTPLQKELREHSAVLCLALSKHTKAKNTVCYASGMCLICESLTHGFIVFHKIPGILFMRKFWHNGKPWQAQIGAADVLASAHNSVCAFS